MVMKINSIKLNNFKRFSELHIKDISEKSKLVLIIGSNGSGKSSIFDSFDFLQKGPYKGMPYPGEESLNYYRKSIGSEAFVKIELFNKEVILKKDWLIESGQETSKKFIGRSSLRNVARIGNNANPNVLNNDSDSPKTFIENDERFTNDVYLYIQSINRALREPVFSGQQADTLKIFKDSIEPLNSSLKNIFGNNSQTTIRISEFEDATQQTPAKLIFQKGNSKINYDLLSHGEKQVVILLLNFIVRQEAYKDCIIYIDEMDIHLNTKLQYSTIQEITEKWIPDTSQLWTASHALGFIDYAKDSENADILDFDDLDFDIPQTISPSPKNNNQIYELAVSREFLDKVFLNKDIYFSEQKDTSIYNDLNITDTLFFDGKDKLGAFQYAKNLNKKALVDRDYLTDEEITKLKRIYPFLYFTPYYNFESLLYHPNNLEEYYQARQKPFDKDKYIKDVCLEKDKELPFISSGVLTARGGYPFFKENEHSAELKKFKDNYRAIIEMLNDSNFETFYKVFNAKEYGKTIAARQNINPNDLAKTDWFKKQIINCVKDIL